MRDDRDNNSSLGKWITEMREALLLFALISVGALILVVLVYVWYLNEQSKFALEVAKSLLQIVAVGVLGGVGSLLVAENSRRQASREKQRDDDRQQEGNRNNFRWQLLQRLNHTYVDTKRARRLLRATAFSPPYYHKDSMGKTKTNPDAIVQLKPYDEHLQALNNTQLDLEDLEGLVENVRTLDSVFADTEQIANAVSGMEKYLNEVIKEYEQGRGYLNEEDSQSRSISNLAKLGEFLKPRRYSKIFGPFVDHYKTAKQAIQRDILTPEEPTFEKSRSNGP